jgi:hypothetical protein
MARRIRLGSEELATPLPKRTKRLHETDEVEVFKDKSLDPSSTTDKLLTGNNTPTSNSTEISSPNPQQPQGNQENKRTQPTTPSENAQKTQKNTRPRPSFITLFEMPSLTTWLTVPQQNNNIPVYMQPRHRPSRPQPKLPKSPPETRPEKRITWRENKPKKAKTEPAFTIFEDSTATIANITEIEDENFSFALTDAHEFVEAYMQKESFLYDEKLVDYPFRCHSARSGPCLFKRAFSANHNF